MTFSEEELKMTLSREELIKTLGLKPDQVSYDYEAPLMINGTVGNALKEIERKEAPTATAEHHDPNSSIYTLDEWELAQGERIDKSNSVAEEGHVNDLSEFFAASFRQIPEKEHDSSNKLRQQFMETLLESSEFKALHLSTKNHVLESDLAAESFLKEYIKLQRKQWDIEKNNQGAKASKKSEAKMHFACCSAAAKALKEAQEQVESFENFFNACGCGSESDRPSKAEMETIVRGFARIKNNPQLRRIIELAGRYRLTAQAKQRQKVIHGYDDMIGVELGGDIARLLPIELGKLNDEYLELDTMRRIVEKEALCRQYRGIEKLGKGPIIVCVDESGSMQGERIANAKALTLAIAWVAKHQKRHIVIASFTHGTGTVVHDFDPNSKWDQTELLDWLGTVRGGGTSLDVPLKVVPDVIDKKQYPKQFDQIIITDGVVGLPSHMKDYYLNWKKINKVRTIVLAIGVQNAGQLETVADEVYCMQGISVDTDAVSSCLSI